MRAQKGAFADKCKKASPRESKEKLSINCDPCQQEGRKQEAHRIIIEDGRRVGKCRWHFQGIPHPAAGAGNLSGENGGNLIEESQINKREATVRGPKVHIELDHLRALHAEGRHDGEIGKVLGCSGPTILVYRRKLGLAANTKRRSAALRQGARCKSSKAPKPANGDPGFISLRIELLDRFWASLEPAEKARVINYSIESRQAE